MATGNGRFAYTTNTRSDTVTGLSVGRYLYVLDGGDDAISVYRVRADGSLRDLQSVEGLPESANGLAAL